MASPAKTALIYLWAPFGNLLWYVETVIMGTISLLVWPFDGSGEMQHACARWWCRMVAVTIGARIHVHGVEQVQAGRSYVYVANHSSLIDTPALFAYLPYQFKIMAKRSLFYVPFMGWHLWSSGNFPIDRGDARKTAKSLKLVIDGVREGKSLMVFPEGTRTPDGRLQEFKHGAFKIAVRAKVSHCPGGHSRHVRTAAKNDPRAAPGPCRRVHLRTDRHLGMRRERFAETGGGGAKRDRGDTGRLAAHGESG